MTDEQQTTHQERKLICAPGMHVFLAQRLESGHLVDYHCARCGEFSAEPDTDGIIAYNEEEQWH